MAANGLDFDMDGLMQGLQRKRADREALERAKAETGKLHPFLMKRVPKRYVLTLAVCVMFSRILGASQHLMPWRLSHTCRSGPPRMWLPLML